MVYGRKLENIFHVHIIDVLASKQTHVALKPAIQSVRLATCAGARRGAGVRRRQQKETEDKLVLTDRPQMTKNDLKTVAGRCQNLAQNGNSALR